MPAVRTQRLRQYHPPKHEVPVDQHLEVGYRLTEAGEDTDWGYYYYSRSPRLSCRTCFDLGHRCSIRPLAYRPGFPGIVFYTSCKWCNVHKRRCSLSSHYDQGNHKLEGTKIIWVFRDPYRELDDTTAARENDDMREASAMVPGADELEHAVQLTAALKILEYGLAPRPTPLSDCEEDDADDEEMDDDDDQPVNAVQKRFKGVDGVPVLQQHIQRDPTRTTAPPRKTPRRPRHRWMRIKNKGKGKGKLATIDDANEDEEHLLNEPPTLSNADSAHTYEELAVNEPTTASNDNATATDSFEKRFLRELPSVPTVDGVLDCEGQPLDFIAFSADESSE